MRRSFEFGFFFKLLLTITFCLVICFGFGQEATVHRTRISFSSLQKSNGDIELLAILKARVGRSYVNVTGQNISMAMLSDTTETTLGEGETDEKGEVRITVASQDIVSDTAGNMTFAARFEGTDTLAERETEITINRGILSVTAEEDDSTYLLNFVLNQIKNGDSYPVEDADIITYVPGMFSRLPVGEGTTDANGTAQITFPRSLQGDPSGRLSVIGIVEEHDLLGNLETTLETNWGIPMVRSEDVDKRTLWSPNPPFWMMAIFVVLLGTVWGHYILIVHKLWRLKKSVIS